MDPDCGVRVWYLRPTFFLKIVWLVISLATVIYLIVLASMCLDPYFSVVIGKSQGVMVIFILIFMILGCIGNALYNFNYLREHSTKVLFTTAIITLLSMILAIIYAAKWGRESYENKTDQSLFSYMALHPLNSETEWFKKRIGSTEMSAVYNYADHRCTGASEAILGLMITWLIIHSLILFIFLQDDEYEGFGKTPLNPNTGGNYK